MSTRDIYDDGFDEDVQQNERNTCPECGGRVTTNTRETVCDECGLVLEEQRIDPGPEWRSFPDQDSRERTGAPRTAARHDRGLSTKISVNWKANGQLSNRKRRQLNRLRREHRRSKHQSKREQNQMHGNFEVRHVADRLELGEEFQEQACRLFETAQNEDLLRGRSIESFGAAVVYAVVRINGLPRTESEVARAARSTAEAFRNAYHVLNRELNLPAAPQRPDQYIPQFASTVDVPERVRSHAIDLAEKVIERGLSNGQRPSGVAAACILVAANRAGVRVTQTELAAVADVTPITIRKQRDRIRTEFGNGTPSGN